MTSLEIHRERLRSDLRHRKPNEAITSRSRHWRSALKASNAALELFGSAAAGADRVAAHQRPGLRRSQQNPRSIGTAGVRRKTRAAKRQRKTKASSAASSKPPRQLGIRAREKAARKRLDEIRAASQRGKVKRSDLIAAVLQNTPRLTNHEIIAALKKEFGWDCKENNLTGHLYTHPGQFTHTAGDRFGKNTGALVSELATRALLT